MRLFLYSFCYKDAVYKKTEVQFAKISKNIDRTYLALDENSRKQSAIHILVSN